MRGQDVQALKVTQDLFNSFMEFVKDIFDQT